MNFLVILDSYTLTTFSELIPVIELCQTAMIRGS